VTKRTSAKYKIDRRMGENIWGRPKSPVNKREYGPGQHGQRRKNKLSDFGTQLRAKQKLKGYYGDLTEKQFRKIYGEAERVRGDTGEMLIGLLERRLDAVVYRAKLVPTIFAARQFVNHGHVLVNGKRVNIASYRVSEGDIISVKEKSRQMGLVLEAIQLTERDVPDYLEVDHNKMTAKVRPHPGPGRCALSGADGTEPGRRILRQELICCGAPWRTLRFGAAPQGCGPFLCAAG
jgi:small subunit ribosomal protein S4